MKKFQPEKFDKDFIDIIENLADALEVDPALFIENIVIRRLAEDRAADDVYGGLNIMPEFLSHDGEMKRGRELYKMLYNLEREKLERDRLQQIQMTGIPFDMLPVEDQEILKRFNQDPASQAKRKQENELYNEYKKELEAEGLKPFYTEKDLE